MLIESRLLRSAKRKKERKKKRGSRTSRAIAVCLDKGMPWPEVMALNQPRNLLAGKRCRNPPPVVPYLHRRTTSGVGFRVRSGSPEKNVSVASASRIQLARARTRATSPPYSRTSSSFRLSLPLAIRRTNAVKTDDAGNRLPRGTPRARRAYRSVSCGRCAVEFSRKES